MATNKQKVAAATAIAAALAAPAEGIRRIAYYDPPGILTVCQGHTGPDIIKGKVYSLDECRKFFTDDMQKAVAAVDKCHPNLPVNVLAAFSDAAFNIGPKVACDAQHSTAAKYLYQGKYIEACNQLLKWDKARVGGIMVSLPGLTKRRMLERDVCLKGTI